MKVTNSFSKFIFRNDKYYVFNLLDRLTQTRLLTFHLVCSLFIIIFLLWVYYYASIYERFFNFI